MPSLQEQLLKAGIADKKKLKKIKHEQRQASAQQPKGKLRIDEAKLAAQKAQAEKVARDRELNKQKQADAQTKALAAQVVQMVAVNRIDDGKGDTAYQFTDAAQIAKIYVTAKQQKELGRGLLAIAKVAGNYAVVPAAVAEKIKQRDTTVIVSQHEKGSDELDQNDPYAAYQIPEGFDW